MFLKEWPYFNKLAGLAVALVRTAVKVTRPLCGWRCAVRHEPTRATYAAGSNGTAPALSSLLQALQSEGALGSAAISESKKGIKLSDMQQFYMSASPVELKLLLVFTSMTYAECCFSLWKALSAMLGKRDASAGKIS